MFLGHGVHVEEALRAYEPRVQRQQCLLQATALNLPAAHASHARPVPAKANPELHVQFSSAVLPTADAACPAHGTHWNTSRTSSSGAGRRLEYVPALHGTYAC